jgi:hypothetical protein
MHAGSQPSVVELPSLTKNSRPNWSKVLLGCGVAASVLYVAMDVVAALLYDGYSYKDQTISELSAVGAPTRAMWLPFSFVYAVLLLAFGVGVWASARDKRSLRVVGASLMTLGVLGTVAWPFAPMHQREVLAAGGGSFSDDLHLMLSAASGVLFAVSVAFGAPAFGWRFRVYSIATVLVVYGCGAFTASQGDEVAANVATPWLGVIERAMMLGILAWYAVFAIALLQREERETLDAETAAQRLSLPTQTSV